MWGGVNNVWVLTFRWTIPSSVQILYGATILYTHTHTHTHTHTETEALWNGLKWKINRVNVIDMLLFWYLMWVFHRLLKNHLFPLSPVPLHHLLGPEGLLSTRAALVCGPIPLLLTPEWRTNRELPCLRSSEHNYETWKELWSSWRASTSMNWRDRGLDERQREVEAEKEN